MKLRIFFSKVVTLHSKIIYMTSVWFLRRMASNHQSDFCPFPSLHLFFILSWNSLFPFPGPYLPSHSLEDLDFDQLQQINPWMFKALLYIQVYLLSLRKLKKKDLEDQINGSQMVGFKQNSSSLNKPAGSFPVAYSVHFLLTFSILKIPSPVKF